MTFDRRTILAGGLAMPAAIGAAAFNPAQAQRAQDTLRVVFRDGVPNIDPYFNSLRTGLVVAHHIWDGLLHRDPSDFSIKPLLATEWNWVNPLTLDFKLREGVTFHNGDAFSADDVVYTLNFISNAENRTAVPTNHSWIDRAEKTGPFSVRVHLKRPTPAALEYFAFVTPIYPAAHRQRVGAEAYSRMPVGTGPYRVTAQNPGALIEMERFENYYSGGGKTRPAIRKLTIRFVPDAATEMTELLSGRADWIWNINPDQVTNLQRLPNLEIARQESMRIGYLSIDAAGRTGAGNPLTNVLVRRAIWHAIDRQSLATNLVQGGSRVPNAPCYPGQFGCDADAAVVYPYNPARARELLTEAGFPNGFDVEMVTYILPQWGAAVQAYLQAVGIRARISQMQVAAAVQRSWDSRNPLYLGSWGSYSINDVSAIFPVMLGGGGGDDYSRDPEITRLVNEAGSSVDPAVRRAAYSAAIRRSTEQAYWLPLHTYVTTYGFTRQLNFQAWADEMPRFFMSSWK